MKTPALLTCLMMVACTPVRTSPVYSAIVEGHQTLVPTEAQATTYRFTLSRSAQNAVTCDVALGGVTFVRGGGPDGGLGDAVPDATQGTRIVLETLQAQPDGGEAWGMVTGETLSPGTGASLFGFSHFAITTPAHSEYVRVVLEPGTGPADSLDYLHKLAFYVFYGRDSVDLDTQTLSLDILTDGGWLPANAMVGSHEQSADCTGPVTPLGCR